MKSGKFEIENRSGELIIRWKDSKKVKWFLLFFALVWNLFIGIFLVIMLATDPRNLWYLSLHGTAGIILIYVVLRMFLNTNEIRVGRGGLVTKSGPIPVPGGNRQFAAEEIDQLFVKNGAQQKSGTRTTQYFRLMLRTKSGKEKSLSGMLSQTEALDLEQKIEDHLGIEDRVLKLDGKMGKFLRKYAPGMADMAEEQYIRQQGKTGHAKGSSSRAPRRIPGPTKDLEPELQHAEPGYIIDYNGNNLAMTAGEQFDWNEDRRSDRRLTVYDATAGESYYLYCEQVSHDEWAYFEERPLTEEEANSLGLVVDEVPPQKLQNGDDRFFSRNAQLGHQFSMSDGQAREVSQQIFVSTSAKERFRLLSADEGREVKLFIQEQISKEQIRDVLAG